MPYTNEDLDLMLAEIAEKIQLSSTDYDKAKERYSVIAELLCDEHSKVAQFDPSIYPQGSFRIQSTISNSDERDEFDIDLLLEMKVDLENDPDVVLDAVFNSLNRKRYKKVEKKKRCVTITYSDMHLDVTPAVPLNKDKIIKPCQIFDCHPDREDHVQAAPEGFANWFDDRVLPRTVLDERALNAKADIAPVPDQKSLEEKPPKLICLQLVKRWRDMQHKKHKANIEKIPSILLSKYIAEMPEQQDQSLFSTLCKVTDSLITTMASGLGTVYNPAYPPDILTDRWPGANPSNQTAFYDDLVTLKGKLLKLEVGSSEDVRTIIREGFGEKASAKGLSLMEGANYAASFDYKDDSSLIEAIRNAGSGWVAQVSDKIRALHEERPPWPRVVRERVAISATVHVSEKGDLIRPIDNGGFVKPGEHVCFQASGGIRGVPKGCRTHWRITNTGRAAFLRKSLRGDFATRTGRARWEHVAYKGVHWAQAFVVDSRGNLVGESERFCIVVE